MRADLAAAAFSIAAFAFLAAMAWTGKLAGIDSTKVRFFAWIVEDLAVGSFGRAGAAAVFAGLGLMSVPFVLWIRRHC
jgi:hypothetical protein